MLLQPDSWLDAARRAHEAGDFGAAIAAYKAALEARSGDPRILFLLGNVFLECGQVASALECLQQAATRQRNHPAVVGSLAQAYFDAERYDDAENTFRKACRLDPRSPQFQIGLANALGMQRKFGEAETLLKRAVARFPDSAYAWMNLGNVARDQSRTEEAIDCYRQALRCDANLSDARNNLGSALHTLLRFEAAEQEYRACIQRDPHFLMARSNLASVQIDRGRFADAEKQCRDMLDAEPAFANAHAMLATAIASQGRLTDAFAHFRLAATLSPATTRYVATYAAALCESGGPGQLDEGLRQFGKLLTQHGDREDAQVVMQMVMPVMLSHGYFAEGWSRHRQRPTALRIRMHFEQLNLQQSLPLADDGTLAGKHICLVCEQGLGDELFFLRFAPQLKAKGVRITYCASPKLGAMLARAGTFDRVVSSPDDIPASDANILVGDLPYALCEIDTSVPATVENADAGTLLREFPWQRPPYAPLPPRSLSIAPLPGAIEQVRERLASAGPPPYLGITWRGGTAPENQRGLEWKLFKEIAIPGLAQALHAWPGTFLALQRNAANGELASLQAALQRPLADFTALNDDLEQMLALLGLIDEYVGVSNTNMHLRAAAGKTARVLVPAPADWRWTLSGESPWFPGFSVYRQSFDGRWDEALETLRRDVAGS